MVLLLLLLLLLMSPLSLLPFLVMLFCLAVTVAVAVDVATVGAVVVAAVLSNDCWCCCDPCCGKRAIPCNHTENPLLKKNIKIRPITNAAMVIITGESRAPHRPSIRRL